MILKLETEYIENKKKWTGQCGIETDSHGRTCTRYCIIIAYRIIKYHFFGVKSGRGPIENLNSLVIRNCIMDRDDENITRIIIVILLSGNRK